MAYRLCGPGKEGGEALLKRFKDIRRTLEQGMSLGLENLLVSLLIAGSTTDKSAMLSVQERTTWES